MDRPVVMFDLDGVCADFLGGYRRVYQEIHGCEAPEAGTWDDYNDSKTWQQIKKSPSFYESLDPLLTLTDVARIHALSVTHDLYFVTSRLGCDVRRQSEAWLDRCFGYQHRFPVIISGRKGEIASAIGADYAIDDKAGNAIYTTYQSPKTKSYLLDTTYNQFDPRVAGRKVRRVRNLYEFVSDVEQDR